MHLDSKFDMGGWRQGNPPYLRSLVPTKRLAPGSFAMIVGPKLSLSMAGGLAGAKAAQADAKAKAKASGWGGRWGVGVGGGGGGRGGNPKWRTKWCFLLPSFKANQKWVSRILFRQKNNTNW